MNHSFFVSFGWQRKLVGLEHLHTQVLMVNPGTLKQPVIGREKPRRLRLFGKCQMQRIERRKSQSGECAGALSGLWVSGNAKHRCVQPQENRQPAVFARIPFVFRVMRGRAHELDSASLGCVQDGGHSFGLAPNSLQRRVIECSLEAADVEVHNVTHLTIVSLQHAESPRRDGSTGCLTDFGKA